MPRGWNAAREPRIGATRHKEVVNPYTSEPEKSRWDEGYANALRGNRQQVRFTPARAPGDSEAE